MSKNDPVKNRHDFVLLFDVKDGNPNGDPDAGNYPRIDAETGCGLVTDVCLKRKIRNYVALRHGYEPPHNIYVKERAVLNKHHDQAHEARKIAQKKRKLSPQEETDWARTWMCENFYDIRTFGAVMNTGVKCGQVRGPVQMTFARSIAPIIAMEHTITRMAVTTEQDSEKQGGDNRTMGLKHTVPYGLYRAHGFVSAHLANDTKFSNADLDLFWEAVQNMFEHDRSAARGEMTMRGLYIFRHDSELGNYPAHQLFDLIKVERRTNDNTPARIFEDFSVSAEKIPQGVALSRDGKEYISKK